MFTPIPAGIRNRRIATIYCNLTDTYCVHEIRSLAAVMIAAIFNVYAIFTSDSRFDSTNGPCSKQVLISWRKISGKPILIQASYQ